MIFMSWPMEKVPAGHMLVVSLDQLDTIQSNPYWQMKYPLNEGHADERTKEQLVIELRSRLLESVHLRYLSSDVPMGILLSGGIDSSSIAGLVAYINEQQPKGSSHLPTCFTIGFADDSDLDECSIAIRTAKALGLPIEKIIVTEQILVDNFDEACWLGEGLMWDLQHIAEKVMSKHTQSRGFKVVLNGDGSDELLGGYSFFVDSRLQADDRRWISSLQEIDCTGRERLQKAHRPKWFALNQNPDKTQCSSIAKALHLPSGFCNMVIANYADWLLPELRARTNPFDAIFEVLLLEEIANMNRLHPLHRSMLVFNKTALPNFVIAVISDGAEMAHSIESRSPFLDHVLAEWVHQLPVDALVRREPGECGRITEKWQLREAVRPFVTDEVYRRQKHPFSAPLRWQLGGPLHKKLARLITAENVTRLGFVDWAFCEDLVDRVFRDKDENLFRNAIWLAQIISIGLQFDMPTWTPVG